MKPKDFIEKVLIEEIGEVVSRHHYLSFALIAIGLEFLGKCMLTEYATWDIKPKKAYDKGVSLLESIDSRYSSVDLRKELRNGFAHTLVPKSGIILGQKKDSEEHLSVFQGKTVLIVEDFYADFVEASHLVLDTTFSNNDKMSAQLLNVDYGR